MSTLITIRHISGSKSNQIEKFPVDNISEVTIGRDPQSLITFDSPRDDVVSRQHAVIQIAHGERMSFTITDRDSSNGTRVNGTPVNGTVELLPLDTVELGSGGPTFEFDVQPRPAHLIARTRVSTGPTPNATRIVGDDMAAAASTMSVPSDVFPTKIPASRETVMREIGKERDRARTIRMVSVVGVTLIVAVVAGALYYRVKQGERQEVANLESANRAQQEQLAQQKAELEKAQQQQATAVQTKIGLSPSEIVQRYGNSTVYIDVQWRVYDRETGKPVYQKVVKWNGAYRLAYIDLGDNKIVRWLTTEDEQRSNLPIGATATGSGFVINDQGFVLTNKHVAAGWMIDYNQFSVVEEDQGGRGVIYDLMTKQGQKITGRYVDDSADPAVFRRRLSWRPVDGGMIFDAAAPVRVGSSARIFDGRDELLEARFPDNRLGIAARLVRASPDADVALVKIDSPQTLTAVELGPDSTPIVGGAITVLGYPGSSVQTYAATTTIENGKGYQRRDLVPEPTVTPGIISRVGAALQQQQGGTVTVLSDMGDVYQLTAPAGAGNSGGPVFDAAGKVIGIFTYGSGRETETMAVPIRYGRALLPVQKKD